MNDRQPDRQAQAPRAGLCDRCANVQLVANGRGSTFYLCRLSYSDHRFRRYPAIPVLTCSGFQPAEPTQDGP